LLKIIFEAAKIGKCKKVMLFLTADPSVFACGQWRPKFII